MKLNFGKRVILFLHWLFSLAACVIAFVYCVAPDAMWTSFARVYKLIGKRQTDIIGAACFAVYIILSVATVLIIVRNREKRDERNFIVVDAGENGRTRIAINAVEQMIRQAVRGIEEIKTMKTSITNLGDAIAIDADVVISDESHVPTVTTSIQHSVRSFIELNCGVSVRSISVNVRAMEQMNERSRHGKKSKANETVKSEHSESAAESVKEEPYTFSGEETERPESGMPQTIPESETDNDSSPADDENTDRIETPED